MNKSAVVATINTVQRIGVTSVVCASGWDEPLTRPAYVKAADNLWFEVGTDRQVSDLEVADLLDARGGDNYRIVSAGIKALRRYDVINSARTLKAEAERIEENAFAGQAGFLTAQDLRERAGEILATLPD